MTLPDTFIAAEEDQIEKAVRGFRDRHAERFTTEASNRLIEGSFLDYLEQGDALEAMLVVHLARVGHPPADRALRQVIRRAIEHRRLAELPVSIQAYASETAMSAPLPPGYPSKAPQVINDYIRDVMLWWLVDRIKGRWPKVPKLSSTRRRRSAAALVGPAFGLSERQVQRIYKATSDAELGRRFAELLTAPLRRSPANETKVLTNEIRSLG